MADATPAATTNGDAPSPGIDAKPGVDTAEAPDTGGLGPGTRGDAAGWFASLVIHAALLLIFGVATLPELPGAFAPDLIAESVAVETLDDAALLDEPAVELADDLTLETPLETPTPIDPTIAALDLGAAPPPAALTLDTAGLTAPLLPGLAGVSGRGVDGRSATSRGALVAAKGGTPASERAIATALRWITEHQNPDGTWSLVHTVGSCRGRCGNPGTLGDDGDRFVATRRAATALALLPYLGAGQTQKRGRHRRAIARGLEALVRLGRPNPDGPGLSWADDGRMYSHGLAAIVLAEAYGLTRDERLRAPAQAALDYIAYAQHPEGGGWRYAPQQAGDTSVTGWQVMALKSGALADLRVRPAVTRGARLFLDRAEQAGGSRYRYTPPREDDDDPRNATRPMTAVGLLCRMYLGWDQQDPRLARGAEWLAEEGPSPDDYYFNYYAAQTLFHYTDGEGPVWRKWNEALRDQLLDQQATRGHERGSWWVNERHNRRGGRLYTTSLATMTLEVYYRYLPIYQAAALEAEFPE